MHLTFANTLIRLLIHVCNLPRISRARCVFFCGPLLLVVCWCGGGGCGSSIQAVKITIERKRLKSKNTQPRVVSVCAHGCCCCCIHVMCVVAYGAWLVTRYRRRSTILFRWSVPTVLFVDCHQPLERLFRSRHRIIALCVCVCWDRRTFSVNILLANYRIARRLHEEPLLGTVFKSGYEASKTDLSSKVISYCVHREESANCIYDLLWSGCKTHSHVKTKNNYAIIGNHLLMMPFQLTTLLFL